MKNTELFHHEEIEKGIIRITGVGNELMYLIIGKNKAALIDTGVGVGNVKEYVESITNLPITVILTHAHTDHSSGSFYFDKVYLSPEDAKILNMAVHYGQREVFVNIVKEFVANTNPNIAKKIDMSNIVTPFERKYETLSDGDVFDLGRISLEILSCPGHTSGSVMILIKELRIIIFGDACNPYVWLQLPESTSIPEYKKSLMKIKLREDEYDRVLLSHDAGEMGKEVLDEIIHLCDEIMAGRCDDIPFDIDHFSNAYVAKKESEDDFGIRADGIIGNIIYKK